LAVFRQKVFQTGENSIFAGGRSGVGVSIWMSRTGGVHPNMSSIWGSQSDRLTAHNILSKHENYIILNYPKKKV